MYNIRNVSTIDHIILHPQVPQQHSDKTASQPFINMSARPRTAKSAKQRMMSAMTPHVPPTYRSPHKNRSANNIFYKPIWESPSPLECNNACRVLSFSGVVPPLPENCSDSRSIAFSQPMNEQGTPHHPRIPRYSRSFSRSTQIHEEVHLYYTVLAGRVS